MAIDESIETKARTDLALRIAGGLRRIRKEKGVTLKQLAQRADTSPQTIQRLETGNMTMSLDWLETLCKGLNISPAPLFDDAHRMAALEAKMEAMREEGVVLRERALRYLSALDKFLDETEGAAGQ